MAEPLPATGYGQANWLDFQNNWRQADSNFLQKRSILRYATTADRNAIVGPEAGMVVFNVQNDRLEFRKNDGSWSGLYVTDGLIIEPVASDIKLRHPATVGNLGLVFTSAPLISTQVPIATAGNEVRIDTTGVTLKTGAATGRISTDATYLRTEAPFLAGSLTSATTLMVQGSGASQINGHLYCATTLGAGNYITAPRLLIGNASPEAANDAVRRDYVDGWIGTRLYRGGDTMTHHLLIHQQNAAGGLCLRLRDVGATPYMDFMDWPGNQWGYLQGSGGGMHMQSHNTLTMQNPWGRVRVSSGDAILQHDGYGYVQCNGSGILALSNYNVDLRAYNGWIAMHTNTGWLFYINGVEYGRIGGPGNGAQWMFGKQNTGSGYKGVEISPNGCINCTTHDLWQVPLQVRQMYNANASNQYFAQFLEHNGTEMGSIRRREFPNGVIFHGVTVVAPSDYRMKNDLGPVVNAVDRVMQLKPRHLSWKAGGEEFDGFFAHEVAEVISHAVVGEKDAVYEDEDEAKMVGVELGSIKKQQLDKGEAVPLLTAALQEVIERVTVLEGMA